MVLKGYSFLSNINLPSEVAALREEKEEAEKKVLAVMKNMQQKDERITLLQVQLGVIHSENSWPSMKRFPLRCNWKPRLRECLHLRRRHNHTKPRR